MAVQAAMLQTAIEVARTFGGNKVELAMYIMQNAAATPSLEAKIQTSIHPEREDPIKIKLNIPITDSPKLAMKASFIPSLLYINMVQRFPTISAMLIE